MSEASKSRRLLTIQLGQNRNKNKLKTMKYDEAMDTKDKEKWGVYVEEDYNKMKKYNFWTSIKFKDVSAEANVLTSTWSMDKKFSGLHIARLNTRGYEQVDGVHYYSANIASPVNNDMNI